ncbi:PIG-L deacetylase family protein [Actinomycetospora cinnamomea]|uniref:GlcNAc-PI de-N-acetylase n=1 Tax=Actinomycetospora cinnamomea TaxID=663609 RepID=A0A2U1EWD1_9PSEU|nr:PIG-L family deacetylase [Actinomycetospora cinnamomea]PVZ04232.1 GlcNAc-PI de-N-acetylase [Actinomycetospora cinnamomea]
MADLGDLSGRIPAPGPRPPWRELEGLRPLTLRACRRLVVVAPHPRDEIRAAGGLLRRLAARHASVDVLALTDGPGRTCTPPEGLALPDTTSDERPADLVVRPEDLTDPETLASVLARLEGAGATDDSDDADDSDDPDGAEGAEDDPRGAVEPVCPADAEEAALAAAYRALGVVEVRRHRLGLPDGGLALREADVVGALSEIVGFVEDPHGLCVLAPWSGDGDDDHEAAGRAAEVVCAAYRVRLVRWLDQAWSWAGPESAEVPWRRARQLALSETVQARKLAASAAFGGRPGRDRELPDGSAPGPREVFLV